MSTNVKANAARWQYIHEWPEGQRLCYTCDSMKVFAEFGRNKNCSLGYDSVCRACRKLKSARDLLKQTQESKIYHRAKSRAKREGVAFNLEHSDIIIPPLCPVFNVPFILGDTHWTPSIGRIDPTKGYVKGNIMIICNRANRLKNDATLEELKMIFDYMDEHLSEAV